MRNFGAIRIDRASAVVRDELRRYTVLIDGSKVGRVGSGQVVLFEIPAGVHQVKLRIDWCSSREVQVEVHPGETATLAASARPIGRNPLQGVFKPSQYIILEVPERSSEREGDHRQPSAGSEISASMRDRAPLGRLWVRYFERIDGRDQHRPPHPVFWTGLTVLWLTFAAYFVVMGSTAGSLKRCLADVAAGLVCLLGATVALHRARFARRR